MTGAEIARYRPMIARLRDQTDADTVDMVIDLLERCIAAEGIAIQAQRRPATSEHTVEHVTEMIVVTAPTPEDLVSGGTHYAEAGYVTMHTPIERDPGVYAVTMFKRG